MAEEKKKPEEEEQKKSETPESEKPEEKKEEPPKSDETEEKTPDGKQTDEKVEDAKSKSEEKPEAEGKSPQDVPELSKNDKLKAENLRLKTQLEAVKIGFKPDCIEDAVVLAENLVKRDGSDIAAALQAVAKKYPDWKYDAKSDKSAGGFKIGADSGSKEKNPDSDRLSQAFGIRKKGKV